MTTMTDDRIAEAGAARAAAMTERRGEGRSDRPSKRRSAPAESPLTSQRAVVRRPIEVRAKAEADAGSGFDFSGYASVTESGYEMWDMFGVYTEVVSRGAFGDSLARADLDVPLVLQHDSLRRIARTTNGSLQLSEDDTGLLTLAPDLDPTDADVAYIAPKLRSGLIDEMSFRFDITAGQWSPDYTEFRINTADIHRGDVAIVGYGANPTTSANLRALADSLSRAEQRELDSLSDVELVDLERALRVEQGRRGVSPRMSLRELMRIE